MEIPEYEGGIAERGGCRCVVVNQTVRRVVTVVCCFLLACTGGFTYTFGNINPYFTSYLRNRTGDYDTDYMDTLWIPQTTSITTNAVMALVGLLSSLLHLKLYIAIGVLLFAVSLFGTYWAVQQSFSLVVFTYGFIYGVGHAFIYPTAINVAMAWAPEKKAFVCGAVLMGYGLGPTAWDQLTTWFINGRNLQPDLHVNDDLYYTQPEVLDKVPDCFLLMGAVLVGLQIVCLIVMCVPPPPPKAPDVKMISHGKLHSPNAVAAINSETPFNGDHIISNTASAGETSYVVSRLEEKKQKDLAIIEKKQENFGAGFTKKQDGLPHSGEDEQHAVRSLAKSEQNGDSPHKGMAGKGESSRQYRPKEVLKSRPFWTIWFMNVGVTVGTVFVLNLYKMADLIAQCALACFVATFVTCEMTGRYAYMFWAIAMFFVISGVFTMTPPLVFAMYGSEHFRVNIGLMDINGVFGSILSVLLAPMLKEAFGWNGMFFMGFAGLFVSILLNMSMSLKCGDSIPDHMRPALSL